MGRRNTGFYAPYRPSASRDGVADLVLRDAGIDDAAAIARIHAERHGGSPADTEGAVARELTRIGAGEIEKYVCVALAGARVVGFGRCSRLGEAQLAGCRGLSPGCYLGGVVVEIAVRRRGIGRALTLHRLDWLRARTNEVFYFADLVNRPSIDLHAALGFEKISRDFSVPPGLLEGADILSRMELCG